MILALLVFCEVVAGIAAAVERGKVRKWYSLVYHGNDNIIPYWWKLLREKTFTNFAVLEPPAKVFSSKFERAVPSRSYVRFSHFLRKMVTLTDLQKFPPSKVSCYIVASTNFYDYYNTK